MPSASNTSWGSGGGGGGSCMVRYERACPARFPLLVSLPLHLLFQLFLFPLPKCRNFISSPSTTPSSIAVSSFSTPCAGDRWGSERCGLVARAACPARLQRQQAGIERMPARSRRRAAGGPRGAPHLPDDLGVGAGALHVRDAHDAQQGRDVRVGLQRHAVRHKRACAPGGGDTVVVGL